MIALEGIEGAGKTTVAERLAARLQALGHAVVRTREPGGVPLAEKIRALLLDEAGEALDAGAEALLFAAARRLHVREIIAPALAAGRFVLVDRYIDSSLVYQGLVGGAGLEAVRAINAFAVGDYFPAVTVLLDLDPDEALRRLAADRRRAASRFDRRPPAFHRRVRDGYLRLAREAPERFIVVDAGAPLEAVVEAAFSALRARYGL
ncbi:dTMP kinase [Hydrogenibacillus sp. N12]|nr:dTMP kinase [Hydrogenibacillus sp. N12]